MEEKVVAPIDSLQYNMVMFYIHCIQTIGYAEAIKDHITGKEKITILDGLRKFKGFTERFEKALDKRDEDSIVYEQGAVFCDFLKSMIDNPEKAYECINIMKQHLNENIK